jgi:DNA-directed RNA polymerase subunit beta
MIVERRNFGKLQTVLEPPDLIEIQAKSYYDFLQPDTPPEKRKNQGLHGVFKEVFPIESYDKRYLLEYVKYILGAPRMSPSDCIAEGVTYSAPLQVRFRLKDGDEVREEDVYMGEIPLMLDDGSFIINGVRRVVVSQLHRSPGICSEQETHASGAVLYMVRIIPDRGLWLDLQFDTSDVIWVFTDRAVRRRKFVVSTFLRALGYDTDNEILSLYYTFRSISPEKYTSLGEVEHFVYKEDVIDINSARILARKYEPVTIESLKEIAKSGHKLVEVVDISSDNGLFLTSLKADHTHSTEEALKEIYQKMRPGEPVTISNAKQLLKRMFFDARRFNLGLVGRYKINQRLGLADKVDHKLVTLHKLDIVEATRYLIRLRRGEETVDDIDHLGNRRVRTIGELIENQCRIGLVRIERLVRERMTLFDPSTGVLTPQRLVNTRALSSVVQDFFARSQLSQFMDESNPLSSIAHKRRLSALGPGGLNRERAGFEVRDVHRSHYGRICPIETPEGPNIGLISSLSIYARINPFGLIETPYLKVVKGKVTDEIEYLTADEEERHVIAQANTRIGSDRRIMTETVSARYRGEFIDVPAERVEYIDISPKQVVSISAALIPFLEHDDANRALMGANMMRQAVPLLRTERPYVATGMESKVANDAKIVVRSDIDGIVAYVSAEKIIVSKDGQLPKRTTPASNYREYILEKFRRTNAGTCYNQKPVVRLGQKVKKGDLLADGPACCGGELALGRNLLVAFMPWYGYNFEDAIVISERLLRDDIFTSIHIEEFEVGARDTKLGPEEITRDIPNVGQDKLKNLGPDGIIRIGAEVKPGDILVGKVTPKSETELAPEERLLRAIFGEKAADVRDTSLTVPSGSEGVVMGVRIKAHREVKNTEMTPSEKRAQLRKIKEEYKQNRQKLMEELTESLSNILLGEKIPLDIVDAEAGEIIIPANRKITKTLLRKMAAAYEHIQIEPSPVQVKIDEIVAEYRPKFAELELEFEQARQRIESGEDTDMGIIKQVKVYVATKRKISVGDKLAGRHGNKGVVAKIVPECDMPFLEDGTPVDIVLNPLGVPSRMNIGQLLETHLGAACKQLGIYAATPVFDGATELEIKELMKKAGLSEDGKTIVRDGKTGEPFLQRVVVGQIYIMKLHHLASDKIHSRSVGPYSLVTQQPLGGKAQYGGQRLGEMEVWALEAHGAAYALQEMLTVKSDDIAGRTKIYESIIKGENTLEPGTPESFNVLVNELRGLALNVQTLKQVSGTKKK